MKKPFLFLLILFFVFSYGFCQNADDLDDSYFDDFDSLFDEASDMEQVVVSEEQAPSALNSFFQPSGIRLSGHVDAGIGYGMIFNDWKPDQTGYLNFENYLYLRAQPSETVNLYADFYTGLISWSPSLNLSAIYIDYNLWNKIFFSVGKKGLSWTSMKLFDGNTIVGGAGSSTILGTVNIPRGKVNMTFVGMLNGSLPDKKDEFIDQSFSTNVSLLNIHYAALMESVLFGTLISLQAHQYHPEAQAFPTYAALELKRTIWGFDVYAHGDTNFRISRDFGKNSFTQYRGIGGFYRKWDSAKTNYEYGINIECRHIYDFASKSHSFELGEELGWNKLLGNHLGIGLSGYHNIFGKSGYITPAFVIKNYFPNANLNTGLTINYGPQNINFVLGTTLSLSLDY